jgi:hypothetical protein
MRKMFQKQWHNIQFDEISTISSRRMAGADFYGKFYKAFFDRYKKFDELDKDWLDQKGQIVNLVAMIVKSDSKVLSVGCGLGYIENCLIKLRPNIDLCVQEVTKICWPWLSSDIKESQRFVGEITKCLPNEKKYDIIYLSGVDYAIDSGDLIGILTYLRKLLEPGGRCLMISASFNDDQEAVKSFARNAKDLAKYLFEILLFKSRGQFWGWSRNESEYNALMNKAGYKNIESGFTEKCGHRQYWISGSGR